MSAERDFVVVEWDDPGGTEWIAPFHVHHADDEAWHVLEGSLRFRVGEDTVDAPAGTTVFVEKGTPHAYGNPSPARARYLLVMTSRVEQLIARLHEGDWSDVHELFREYESELCRLRRNPERRLRLERADLAGRVADAFEARVRAAEEELLSPLAVRSYETRGRLREEEECGIRTPFQRDRDRIVHSKPFRRLKGKTQVFIDPAGDHYRTRITHTLETTGIARVVARALRLNEDLTEAIGLGHDTGHPPFGHAGEERLDACLRERFGSGFRHNEQSLRIAEELNLTEEVRDGILTHTGEQEPATLEGKIVRLVDRVAYINHDIDDAIRWGLLTPDDLPRTEIELLGETGSRRIDTLVHDLIESSEAAGDIVQSDDVGAAMLALRSFMFERVYLGEHARRRARARTRDDRPHLQPPRRPRRLRGRDPQLRLRHDRPLRAVVRRAALVARIKESSVREVVSAADMVEVVSGRTALRKAGARYSGRCPFHEERTPSFSVNPADKLYHCFGCGKGGDVITFVRETENLDFAGAVEWLAERFRVTLEYEETSPQQEESRKRRDRLHAVLDQAASFYERYLWDDGRRRPGARLPREPRPRRSRLPRVPPRPLARHRARAEGARRRASRPTSCAAPG